MLNKLIFKEIFFKQIVNLHQLLLPTPPATLTNKTHFIYIICFNLHCSILHFTFFLSLIKFLHQIKGQFSPSIIICHVCSYDLTGFTFSLLVPDCFVNCWLILIYFISNFYVLQYCTLFSKLICRLTFYWF